MKKFALTGISVFLFFSCKHANNTVSLRSAIGQIALTANGTVGVAIMNLESGDTLTYNGRLHLPMQSVFKFPIALAILNKVDSGMLSLDKQIHISKEQMDSKTWSPIRDKYPDGNIDMNIRDLLGFMVSQSDNVACDVLIQTAGGPKQVENYIHSLGNRNIAIAATEAEMHGAWEVQYTNWCEPQQMMYLLYNFYTGKYLSPSNTKFLVKIMTQANTSVKRIKGLLPVGTIVARKSGSGPTNKEGVTSATNDVGIVTLPNGKHFIIAAFVSDSKANDSIRDMVIARIAKEVWDNDCKNKLLQ